LSHQPTNHRWGSVAKATVFEPAAFLRFLGSA